MGFMVKS